MASSVWKFKVPIEHQPAFATVMMPAFSEIIHAGHQGDDVFVWAVIDTTVHEAEKRRIGAFPTGYPIESEQPLYLGTTKLYSGSIVVHVFEDMAASSGERRP